MSSSASSPSSGSGTHHYFLQPYSCAVFHPGRNRHGCMDCSQDFSSRSLETAPGGSRNDGRPLTPAQRQRLKHELQNELSNKENPADPLVFTPVTLEGQSLLSVKGNTSCGTQSLSSLISDDILDTTFREFLYEPANEPRIHDAERAGGRVAKVQVSALVEMSNKTINLDTIALTMPRQAMPNQRSEFIIGQRAAIDCIQYISTPRKIMPTEDRDPIESYWGVFEITKYLDANGELVHV